MRGLVVAIGLMAASLPVAAAEGEAVTLETLQKEIRELKAEVQGLRRELRTTRPESVAAPHRMPGGTNALGRAAAMRNRGHNPERMRPPSDPAERNAWMEERRREFEARRQAHKAGAAPAAVPNAKPERPAPNGDSKSKD